ncbi:MAG: ribonuclease III [Microbacteriaceae bacterium]
MKKTSNRNEPEELAKKLGITIDAELLRQSLTHRSYAYENGGIPDNERLEFLGDTVLGRAVTIMLYQTFPEIDEGELAQRRASLVSTTALARIAHNIGLGQYLFLGRGEENSGGRNKDSLLADAVEAVLGAHFLSEGDPASEELVLSLVRPLMAEQERSGEQIVDSKTQLQEYAAAHGKPAPHYQIEGSGPDHERVFGAIAHLGDEAVGTGRGTSKKQAELNAASDAIEKLSLA